MRDGLRLVAAVPQRLRQRGEPLRRALGERLPRLAGPQPLGIRERPLELVAGGRVPQVFQDEVVGLADAVGPVGADAEALQVADDQQRRVVQRQRVLPQLPEGGVQVGVRAFVLPAEMAALPHVGPAAAARVLFRAALEAVALAGGVGFDRRRLAEHAAQVVEVRLRRLAFLQLGSRPLGDELVRRHAVMVSPVSGNETLVSPIRDSREGRPLHSWSAPLAQVPDHPHPRITYGASSSPLPRGEGTGPSLVRTVFRGHHP